MDILVCFSITSDYDYILPEEWEEKENLEFSFVKKRYSYFDEGALETALRLKDQYIEKKVPIRLTAVTTGLKTPALITALYGAGYDEVIYIENMEEMSPMKKETAFRPELSSILQNFNADIILTGKMSGGFDERMIAPCLAAEKNIPWLMDGVDLYPGDQPGEVCVWCERETEYVLYNKKTPFVCSMGNARHGVLRMFSIKARMEAKKKKISVITAEKEKTADCGVQFYTKKGRGNCRQLTGDADALAEKLDKMITRQLLEH